MKTAKIATVMGLVIGVAGVCLAFKVWAEHRNLVTLHVRDVPLAEVVRMIENQTREMIRVDGELAVNVTLDVENAALTNVLDQLAEQAGARWGKTYAVYDSKHALNRLESVFTGGSTLDAEGWTNLAPQFARTELPLIGGMNGGPGPQQIVIKAPDGSMKGKSVTLKTDDDVQKFLQDKIKGGGVMHTEDVDTGDGPAGGVVVRKVGSGTGGDVVKHRVMMRVSQGPDGITTTTTTMDGDGEQVNVARLNPGGEIVQEDHWSRERMVIETPLVELLGGTIPDKATSKTAAETAAKIHGQYATYFEIDKPPIGGDFRMTEERSVGTGDGGTNDPMAVLRAEQQEKAMGGLGKLSPEEQVQRARQMQESKGTGK